MGKEGLEISRQESYQGLAHYLGRNSEVAETQVDEIFLSGIKAEIVSMEECQNQRRGKGIGMKVYVSKRSTGSMHRV